MFWGRNKKTRKGKLAVLLVLHIAPYFILIHIPSQNNKKKKMKERTEEKNEKQNRRNIGMYAVDSYCDTRSHVCKK
jgi:hypothetical protein